MRKNKKSVRKKIPKSFSDILAIEEGLGSIEIVMSSFEFRPRPVKLRVNWTRMSETILEETFKN